MNYCYKFVGLLACVVLVFSCQKENLGTLDGKINELQTVELNDENGVPLEYIKILREMGITSEVTYDPEAEMLYFEDTGIDETYLAYFLLNDMELEDDENKGGADKGYTFTPNHVADVSLPSIVRCKYGQSKSDFENHRMRIKYGYESNFDPYWKPFLRDAFDIWEAASGGKFEWVEVPLADAYTTIEWKVIAGGYAGRALPPTASKQAFHLGPTFTFNPNNWNTSTGTSVVGRTTQQAIDRFRNVALHEIGHHLGFTHFHNAVESNRHHVPGTAVDVNQWDVSVMNYNITDIYRQTLFPDDITMVQTLYPFTGNASTAPVCECIDEYPNIATDGTFANMALADFNNTGSVSTGDLLMLRREILGITQTPAMTANDIQRAGALDGNVNSVSTSDVVALQRFLLGINDWQDPISQDQFVKLADANGDGILNSSDKSGQYLPAGTAVFNLDYSNYSNYVSEVQVACGLIDGDGDTYTSQDWKTWTNNF